MRREWIVGAIGFAALTGPAVARPCRLDANDKPVHCPPAKTAPPTTAKPRTAQKDSVPADTVRPVKPPPRMLSPQRLQSDQ